MIGNFTRREALLTAAGLIVVRSARAAGYPERPVKIVVPFAPGGPSDIMARVMAGYLSSRTGGSFVVENHGGAGGNIGAGVAARATPDGYTLLIHSSPLVVNPSLYKKVPYDITKDFAPLVELGTSPNVFVANPAFGIKSIADLVARAKADPKSISYASGGIGTPAHLSGELLKLKEGIEMTHVPYASGGLGMQAVLQNTTPVAALSLPPALPMIKAGQLVALAVTGKTRWPELPQTPTMVEAGYPGFVTDNFQVFLAPAKTPQAIVDLLVKTTLEILHDPKIAQQLLADGFEVIANGPAGLQKRIDDDVPMWRDLIEKSGLEKV